MGISRIKLLASGLIRHNRLLRSLDSEVARKNHLAAELSRFTHSIEKGMTIQTPRLGFGHDKQRKMMQLIVQLESSQSAYHTEVCAVAMDALQEYLNFHEVRGYRDEFFDELEEFIRKHQVAHEGKLGGVYAFKKEACTFDADEMERFFHTRHSIRDFAETDVDDAALAKALRLAQYAPSACNRQGVRAYVLNREKSGELAKNLSGIGGFADKASRLILITGKTSAYRADETYQYIVSASIYAAYLSLTLHAYGLASCVVQRQVVWSRDWDALRQRYGIPEDEQIVIMLAVGNMKDECLVPVSHRLENEEMIKFI